MIRTLIIALAVAFVIGCNRTDAPLQAQDRPDDKPAGQAKPKHAPRKKPKLPSPQEIAMLPPDGGPDYNRLIHEKSPYLRQHATNPVDWYPWGDEAFALAKKLDRPIFLSVGYSTCHWCHVMAHESFEDEGVAKILNEQFVSIKVDREERPDVDELYMAVTQMMTRHGGWPNTVFLTPTAKPFWAGTYFPKDDQGGRPGFISILKGLSQAWTAQRDDIKKQAEEIAEAVRRQTSSDAIPASGTVSRQLVTRAVGELRRSFDGVAGGFGDKPKFPPHGSLALLLYEYARTKDDVLLEMVTKTLDAIRLGGIHDHVGGGFARYATDSIWFLPHFEKMLYDNAQLARAYVDAWRLTKNEAFRRTALKTFDWVLREMRHESGAFWSAYDADSEGEEGKFYLWPKAEILAVLGDEDGALLCEVYNATDSGNYYEEATGHRPGTNILYLTKPLEAIAKARGEDADAFRTRIHGMLDKLYAVRKKRVWPHLDDKVLTSWNALMIGTLAHAGDVLEDKRLLDAATTAAEFVFANLHKDERLLRTWRDGGAKLNAYLDDYTQLASACLDLHDATEDERWLNRAERLMKTVEKHFIDAEDGGYFFTSDDHETLIARSKQPFDGPAPSGNGVAAQVHVELASLTGDAKHLDRATEIFGAFLGVMERAPRAAESMLLALSRYYDDHAEHAASKTHKTTADATTRSEPVTADAWLEHTRAAPGTTVRIALRLALDKGWHVYADVGDATDVIATTARLAEGMSGATLASAAFPAPLVVELGGSEVAVHAGETWVLVTVSIAADASGTLRLPLEVRYQACDDRRCLEATTLALPLEITVATDTDAARHADVFKRFTK